MSSLPAQVSSRAGAVLSHLTGSPVAATTSAISAPGPKRDDDIVIVSALRTPIGRAKKGIFKDTYVEDLLAAVLKATVERTKVDVKDIGDIVVGTVLGSVTRSNRPINNSSATASNRRTDNQTDEQTEHRQNTLAFEQSKISIV